MSSFFTYKSISAKENFIQYAFFMPQNTLQENTTIKEFSPLTQDYSKNTPSKPKKIKKIIKKKVLKKKNTQTPKHKKTFPVVKSELKKITDPVDKTKQASTKQQKYVLEDIKPITKEDTHQETIKTQKVLSLIEQLNQTKVETLLNNIPHPDISKPIFKQLYALYGMDLRTLNRRGKFPTNLKQEKALKKATSIQRFKVTD